ncbi:MAG: glutamate ligase domain-containing protein, partial [Gammaproteobacteria bacterium]
YADKVVLIAGGDCKGADMREFGDAIRNKVKAAVLLGKDAKIIDSAIGGAVPVYFVETIENAVKIASEISRPGDTVLLSPACASLDQFTSYKERGQRFADAVRRLAA